MITIADIAKRASAEGGVRPVEADIQLTLPASVDFEAGDAAYIDTAGGFAKAGTYYGAVAKGARAGLGVTAIRVGIFDGLDVSGLGYGDPVYLSIDTAGAYSDAALAADGTTSQQQVGIVVPGHGSSPADKLVFIEGAI